MVFLNHDGRKEYFDEQSFSSLNGVAINVINVTAASEKKIYGRLGLRIIDVFMKA